METTTNYGLKKPGQDEFYDVGDFNDNMDKIDAELEKCSNAVKNPMEFTTEFEQAETRVNIKSGEKLKVTLGKIAKFFGDLHTVAFTGKYIDLEGLPTIPTIPSSLKNPYAFKANGKTYDGSSLVDMGTLGLGYGGTGATTASAARTNLGLKAAATQNVANNCTTTEAGSVLDARQGKVLLDKCNQLDSDLEDLKTYKVITLSTPLSAGSSITIPELIDAKEVAAYTGHQSFVVKQYEKGISIRSATYNTFDGTNSTYYQVYHVSVEFLTGKVSFAGSKGVSAGELKITKIYYR